jgi:hypothetical protein
MLMHRRSAPKIEEIVVICVGGEARQGRIVGLEEMEISVI